MHTTIAVTREPHRRTPASMRGNSGVASGAAARSTYLLGIGSNVAPQQNVPAILTALLSISPRLYVSRIVRTAPEGMVSAHDFLNAVVLVDTPLAPEALKQQTNRIEEALGRDRSAPDCKTRDRPADIDLLARMAQGHPTRLPDIKEDYLRPLAAELIDYVQQRPLHPPSGTIAPVRLGALQLGQTPTAIYRDDRSALVRICQQR